MNKDLKDMPIDNRATSDGSPFRNNAIKKMEGSALFNKNKVDEFGNPIPKDFVSDVTREVVGTPYSGRAFVGTRGNKRQAVGASVKGFAEKSGNQGEFVTGIVQPKSIVGPASSSIIKGQSFTTQRIPSNIKKSRPGGSRKK
jgi:hypothetical protein